MDQSLVAPSGARRAKSLIGGAIIAATLAGLVLWAMGRPGSTSFFYTPTEVVGLSGAAARGDYRVNGKVLPDTVRRSGLRTTFAITDGRTEMYVTTTEPLPDAFWTAMAADSSEVEVIARGNYDGQRFTASEVLAKCPSKFKAKAQA